MTINEEIHTVLTYKEVVLIAIALKLYQDKIKKRKWWKIKLCDQEMINAARKITDRLNDEMYSYPIFNFISKK